MIKKKKKKVIIILSVLVGAEKKNLGNIHQSINNSFLALRGGGKGGEDL